MPSPANTIDNGGIGVGCAQHLIAVGVEADATTVAMFFKQVLPRP